MSKFKAHLIANLVTTQPRLYFIDEWCLKSIETPHSSVDIWVVFWK